MSLISRIIDLIYPPVCLVCGEFLSKEPGSGRPSFCTRCLKGFRHIVPPACTVCGIPFATGVGEDHACENCIRKPPHFKSLSAPYLYEGTIMEALHRFKYGPKSSYAGALGPLIAGFAGSRINPPAGLVVMPVPLHKKRLRERGFNQSLLLARHVARELDRKLDFLSLRRVKYTTAQTGLGREERRQNVKGAFRVIKPEAVSGREVLLVDDVATTGHTLNECAGVLGKAGAKEVRCLVLARTGNMS